ncbi:MAG: CPBP family intramembrane metalloprotease [Ruminococcus sp.]|nr:CPBP family intramembrane metalloprotease [Ruminococcus sp.]
MKAIMKKALIFTLCLIPISAIAGIFAAIYQFDVYDPAMLDEMISQIGNKTALIAITAVQTVMYAVFCGFFGYILAEKLGLMRSFGLEKKKLLHVLIITLAMGVVLSLDYWTFGAAEPALRDGTASGLTPEAFIGSVLYGGIIEEVMIRLFMMSLIAFLAWKIFFRKHEKAPTGVIIAANIIAAILFAAGHLPATIAMFGELTPLILFRCFLMNGGFGLAFGWLYQRYGIQYAMLAHAGCHIVSKVIWLAFI